MKRFISRTSSKHQLNRFWEYLLKNKVCGLDRFI